MEQYEAFFDEYVEFMQKYKDSDDTMSMLSDYADYMEEYEKTMDELEDIDEDELTEEELILYEETTLRIQKKLQEIE